MLIPVMVLGGLTSACNKQRYGVDPVQRFQQAGKYVVPPKVDLVLAQDDSPSMHEAFDQIQSEMPGLAATLDSKKDWDYRFATIPLTTYRKIEQIIPSKFDVNWYSLGFWSAPFPGADPDNSSLGVFSEYFRVPPTQETENMLGLGMYNSYQYTDFMTSADLNNGLGPKEPGFQNIFNTLKLEKPSGGGIAQQGGGAPVPKFIRNDALLAMIVLSNGEDTSGVYMCPSVAHGGQIVPCGDGYWNNGGTWTQYKKCGTSGALAPPLCDNRDYTLDYYEDQLKTLRPNASLVKFYAGVAYTATNNCKGGTSRRGDRYIKMSQRLGGTSINICTNSITSFVGLIEQSLANLKKNYRTRYLMLDFEPDLNQTAVYKYPESNPSLEIQIPRFTGEGNPTNYAANAAQYPNGYWVYEGYKTVFTIDLPVNMNQVTGHAIRLYGPAVLWGDDTASVIAQPAGTSP